MQIDHANQNGEIVFEDGDVVHADIILHCTGYDFKFQPLYIYTTSSILNHVMSSFLVLPTHVGYLK